MTEALLQERQDNLLAAIWRDSKGYGYATLDMRNSSGRFRLSEPADRETMAAELQRTNPAELLYAEDLRRWRTDLRADGACVAVRYEI